MYRFFKTIKCSKCKVPILNKRVKHVPHMMLYITMRALVSGLVVCRKQMVLDIANIEGRLLITKWTLIVCLSVDLNAYWQWNDRSIEF